MSERYWTTGVQLGMLIALASNKKWGEISKLVDEITDKQFIGNMKEPYEKYTIIIIDKVAEEL